jgi:integrase
MAGHIRVEHCPGCRRAFSDAELCPACGARPHRYLIDLWVQGVQHRIYKDQKGFPLDSYSHTFFLLAEINWKLADGNFDPADYVARELQGLLFENYADAWLARLAQEVGRPAGISRAYFKELRRYVRTYFRPAFGRLNIRDLRNAHILDFKRGLPAHLSRKTVANILGALHRLLAEALERKDLLLLPGFPKIGKHEPRTRWLPWPEFQAVLAHCREPYRTLFLFCRKQGCRPGEARALKWPLVDLRRKTVTIAASMDLGHFKAYTKEGEVREQLPLNSQVREALLALPRSLASDYVFFNQAGRPLSDTRVRSAWKQAAAQAGLQISCYEATRHSFATQKLLEGHSEALVMKITGHKTRSAFARYTHLATEELRGVIEDGDQGEGVAPLLSHKD